MPLIYDILDSAGIRSVTSSSKQNEITICCPFCVERDQSEDSRFRLGINVNTGFGHCFNCDWSSRSLLRTARELCRVFDLKMNLSSWSFTKSEEPKKETLLSAPITMPDWYERITYDPSDEIMDQAFNYLLQRGITRKQIKAHRIGFASTGRYSYRVLFPVLGNDKKLHGLVGRDFTGNSSVKYLNTPGIKLLWNAHKPTRYAVVAEGIMDALRIEQAIQEWGFHEITAIARLGSAITDLQLSQLSEFDEVCVCPDWDKPGIDGSIQLAERCAENHIKCSVAIPDMLDGRDPGCMESSLIGMQIKNAKPWSKATEFRLRSVAEPY